MVLYSQEIDGPYRDKRFKNNFRMEIYFTI